MKRPCGVLPVQPFRLNHASCQADGLVSWWAAAAGPDSTGIHDMCGGSSATLSGPIFTNTQFGTALYFDGNNDEASAAAKGSHHSAALTLTAWVNRTATNTTGGIVSRSFNATGGYQEFVWIFLNSNNMAFAYHTENLGLYNQYNSTGAAVGASVWQHVAISYRFGAGASMAMYQNGLPLSGSWVARNGNDIQSASANYPVVLGRQAINISYPHWFGGYMYDVRYYNRALVAAEIAQMYDPATRWELYQPRRRVFAVNLDIPATFVAQGALEVYGTADLDIPATFAAQGALAFYGAVNFNVHSPYAVLLNDIKLPYPDRDGISQQRAAIGVAFRGSNGLTQRVRAAKNEISIRWSLCTATERQRLLLAWRDCVRTPRSLVLPNNQTYTVLATGDFEEQQIYDGALFYNATLTFSEV